MQCPNCKKAVAESEEAQRLPDHYPFCCERCKMTDLGNWFSEEYRISRPMRPGEGETPEE